MKRGGRLREGQAAFNKDTAMKRDQEHMFKNY